MALTLTSVVLTKLTFSQRDTQDSNTVVNAVGQIAFTGTLADGTGNRQNNVLYNDIITISSGSGQRQLDLYALDRTVFGGTSQVSFSGGNIKCIAIKNTQTGVNQDLLINGTGANGFSLPFGGATGLPIPAQSPMLLTNFIAGWELGTDRYINIIDVRGTGASFELAIVGVQ